MSLRIDVSGFDPRDVRVLVDRNQLLVSAAHSETRSTPAMTSSDCVTSGYTTDVTRRRLSRRYLLPGCMRATDLCCCMTSDGSLIIEGEIRRAGSDHVTSATDNDGKTTRSDKHVKFDLLT